MIAAIKPKQLNICEYMVLGSIYILLITFIITGSISITIKPNNDGGE
jgi:hypothetical protein